MLSLRFKHGTHTIFLSVDPLSPFSNITDELLETLRERYPGGLSISNKRPDLTPIPDESEEVRLSYAVLKNPRNIHSGWKNLNISGSETPASKSLKDNMIVAFAIQAGDMDTDDEPLFEVEFPELEDDDDEEEVSE